MRDYGVYGAGDSLADWLRLKYLDQTPEEELAQCIACGWCEEQCPQHLHIIREIGKAKDSLVR
jgi:predicted aldo/keto reductase-like oxidoreductase